MKIQTFGVKEIHRYKGSPREDRDALAGRPARPTPVGLNLVKE